MVAQAFQGDAKTILHLKYWCIFEDEFWQMPEQESISLASEELRWAGIVKDAPILGGSVYYIPRCYPIYEKGYRPNLNRVKTYLDQIQGLQAIGRYGAFNYTNQDYRILMGLLAAENVANAHQHDLWKINSEEQYQEDSVICDSGIISNLHFFFCILYNNQEKFLV